jgi:predicted nucleic acid-binding Zn ribbon protein
MPLYLYRRADGTTFEITEPINKKPLQTDPETGQPVQRVLFAPTIHFKGKGFHNTDYGTRTRPLAPKKNPSHRRSGSR